MVDARANTKVRTKSTSSSVPEKAQVVAEEEDVTDEEDDDVKLVVKSVRKKRSRDTGWKHQHGRKSSSRIENQMPTFLDPQLWHK